MTHNISAATFIRDNIKGAFCLFESMASLLPLVSDMHIIDMGSTDGTLEILKKLTGNPKIILHESRFSKVDAGAFADAANECVKSWFQGVGIFWQADEIWHPNVIKMLDTKLSNGVVKQAFWRYQLRDNFQKMKWFPHPVYRLGLKNSFNFTGDGMNADGVFGVDVCSDYNMGWFTKWGEMPELSIPVEQMVMDVSMVGGFRDNIPDRRNLHAPMWHESNHIEGKEPGQWHRDALANPDWQKETTPFDIPPIMRWHVGRVKYDIRPELIEALLSNNTDRLVYGG